MIEDKLFDIIKNEGNIIVSDIMTDEMKKEVIKLEMKRLDEMVPLINKGFIADNFPTYPNLSVPG